MALTIPDFSKLNLLVAGDAMLDEYWFGDTARISPEAPVPVVRAGAAEQRPGGAANVALNVAALGARSVLAAVVGQDERGERLARTLEQRGVRCELVRSPSLPTVHKLRVLARSQQLLRIDAEQSLEPCAGELVTAFAGLLSQADAVILSEALALRADVLVTGDKDLLEAGEVPGISILDPRGFWQFVRGKAT